MYDMDAADAVMAELEKFRYTDDDGLVEWLRENFAAMNFTEITEKISNIL
jgi:hypothetical protein